MADLSELERMRQANKLANVARNHLRRTQDQQDGRWKKLDDVINDAVLQFTTMRADALEQPSDDGPPQWFSIIITIGIGLLPVSAWSSLLLAGLTKATQRVVGLH
jgi:hypothetical protein